MDWKDHVPEDQRGGLICEYDDGSAVFHSSSSGGAAPEGSWGSVSLMRVTSDGTTTFRDYSAKGDWRPMQDGPRPMCFGDALQAMKRGQRVARNGWNGKGMWIALTPGSVFDARHAKPGHAAKFRADELQADLPHDGTENVIELTAHIDMRAADGSMVVGWLASQTDMMADDWMIVS